MLLDITGKGENNVNRRKLKKIMGACYQCKDCPPTAHAASVHIRVCKKIAKERALERKREREKNNVKKI